MKIINNPDDAMLEKIQSKLNKENSIAPVGIQDIHSNGDPKYFVAIENNNPIGVATIQFESELFKLYVTPENRHKNIANQLVKYVMSELKRQGEEDMLVEMTDESIKFWATFIQKNNYDFNQLDGTKKLEITL